MKTKKSQLFSVMLVFVVFVALFSLAVIFSSKKDYAYSIGENQFKLLKSAQNAENSLLYLDKSVDFASFYALNETAHKGGYVLQGECGKFRGYSLWNCEKSGVFPDGREPFIAKFSNKLDEYLASHPHFIKDNYHLYFSDGKLKGKALTPITTRDKVFRDSDGLSPEEVEGKQESSPGELSKFAESFAERYNLPYVWGGISPYTYDKTVEEKESGNPVFSGVHIPESIPEGNERGGESITPGFDCSGFVWWSLRHISLDVGRKSAEGYYEWAKENGDAVCDNFNGNECTWEEIKEEAAEGDLLFIDPCSDRKVCHIGIYTGNKRISESAGGIGLVNREIPENYKPGEAKEIAAVYSLDFDDVDKISEDDESEDAGDYEAQDNTGFVYDAASTGDELFYTVKPSFTQEVDIDLYQRLRRASLELIDNVENCEDDLETCIDDDLDELNEEEWKWSTECGSDIDNFRYNVSDLLYSCLNSEGGSCYCEIDLPENKGQRENFVIMKTVSEDMVFPDSFNAFSEMDEFNRALRSDKSEEESYQISEFKEILDELYFLQTLDLQTSDENFFLFESILDGEKVYLIYDTNSVRVVNLTKDDEEFYTYDEISSLPVLEIKAEEKTRLEDDALEEKCFNDDCLNGRVKEIFEEKLADIDVMQVAQSRTRQTEEGEEYVELSFNKPENPYLMRVGDNIKITYDGDEQLDYDQKLYLIKEDGNSGLILEEDLDKYSDYLEDDLQKCEPKPINKEKFCVESEQKIPVAGEELEFKNITYNFALYFNRPKTI
ncbi:MAG: C40 family peptidase [Nanoarchaeota archaeon]